MLFQESKLTLGKAIQLSGLSRFEFERSLGKNKIPVSNATIEQIQSDVAKLEGHLLNENRYRRYWCNNLLVLVKQLKILLAQFDEFYIAKAVWNELQSYDNPEFDKSAILRIKERIVKIKGKNNLSSLMDYGESEKEGIHHEIKALFQG